MMLTTGAGGYYCSVAVFLLMSLVLFYEKAAAPAVAPITRARRSWPCPEGCPATCRVSCPWPRQHRHPSTSTSASSWYISTRYDSALYVELNWSYGLVAHPGAQPRSGTP
eukprot:25468-Heterocapsa_arctica.AAC.1